MGYPSRTDGDEVGSLPICPTFPELHPSNCARDTLTRMALLAAFVRIGTLGAWVAKGRVPQSSKGIPPSFHR